MRVFLDAMIYIKYFSAELVQSKILQEIEQLTDEGKITLVFPDITFDEVHRNCIEEITDYKKKIKYNAFISKLPPSVLKGTTYTEAKDLAKKLDEKMERLREEFQASMDSLMKTVETLKEKAEKIPEPEDLVGKAHRRRLLGKLPYPTQPYDGLGDSIAWELLLGIEDAEKTIIVTEDTGWKNRNEGDANALHPSMEKEWNSGSRGQIKLYHSLSGFLKNEFPKVKLSKTDIELDKKASQSNPSVFPMTFPVIFANGSGSGSPSVNMSSMGSVAYSPSSRAIACVNCHSPIFVNANFSEGVAKGIENETYIVCPFCGHPNRI